jgi:hypothetical protein
MVKKKQTKAQADAARIKKSAAQQVWRVQNKLDQKRLDPGKKKELEKSLQEAKKRAGYAGPTKREEKRLSKEKNVISVTRAKLTKKFKDPKTSIKEKNRLRKQIMALSGREREVKGYLGKKVKKLPKRVKKPVQGAGVVVNQEPPWRVKADYIDPAMDGKTINTFVIDGESLSKRKRPDKVYDAWQDLEATMLVDGSDAIALIVTDYNKKTMSISRLV